MIFNFCRDNDSCGDPERPPCNLPVGLVAEGGQATQGTRWMPWRQEPMKDVVGSEMPRGAANML
jgi:hypothetical protein